MATDKYFKPEQKVLLRHLDAGEELGHYAALTAYVVNAAGRKLHLRLPYATREGEGYPFAPDMNFEILTDTVSMGIRVTGKLVKTARQDELLLELNNDMQAFQRRAHGRKDVNIGLRYTKGQGTLRTFHHQWLKNNEILDKTPAEKLPTFPTIEVNLSRGGVRFTIKKPIAVADLCILLIDLADGDKPFCALAEVVWQATKDQPQHRDVGMQFLHIRENDQKRIDAYLKKN